MKTKSKAAPSVKHIKEDMKQENRIIKAAKEMRQEDKEYLAKRRRK